MSGSAASDAKPCPHCGAPLDRGLALHMARAECEAYTSASEENPPPSHELPERYDALPLLEDADDPKPVDDERDERRALADELAEENVWV